ncbi:hypothetical protein HHK36_031368 [Tetracentron sinense]|uniref:Pentatricopeptide repeat-containing protein n=1 Tax=Tetracentron sinense TaxID=13715 RepID=A0A834YEL7_TETSI|nr:hypothetical protein HHK36_031368 [Tetracentron sinense]
MTPRSCHISLYSLLLEYTEHKNLPRARVLHAQIMKMGLGSDLFLSNNLVNLYSKCGNLVEANLQFEEIENKDVVSWNCLINGYSQQGRAGSVLVLQLFHRMMSHNSFPNPHTFAGIFTATSNLSDPCAGKQAHSLAIKTANCSDVFVGSSLLNMYCKSGLLSDALQVFDRMPHRNSVSWAAMISGYALQRLAPEALDLFKLMHRVEDSENEFVFTSVLSALALPEFIGNGKQIHCLAVKNGLLSFVSVGNSLVTMYAKCGSLGDALQTFELSSNKNSITWSAMITGYSQCEDSDKALMLFSQMQFAGIRPSEFTFVGVLNACSNIGAVEEGKQVHNYLLKLGFEGQIFIRTSLVDMYAKCGRITDARRGFDQLQEPDIVLWTSMIGGYVQNGENEEALSLYARMEMQGILPNALTMASVLRACSSLAALEQGKQIHARIIKHGFGLEVPFGTALSTMYAKCGNLEDGSLVFRRTFERDVVSWNSMISGLSQNGRGNEALELFEEMLLEGTKPDYVTFVNLLSACSHMGMVERGWAYFKLMVDECGIVPRVEHYACMVDILSRAGKLNEAKEFIESISIDHGMSLWRILLGACRNYRNFDIGAYAGEKLMELGSQESSAYVLLSSIYTALGRWEDVERIRRMMKLRGVNKEPGCSWIELKSCVHVFVVGDQLHPYIGEIRAEVRSLTKQMKDEEVDVGGAQPKRRTFKKFSFRGVDLDQLLDMGTDELVKLFNARARRSYSDSYGNGEDVGVDGPALVPRKLHHLHQHPSRILHSLQWLNHRVVSYHCLSTLLEVLRPPCSPQGHMHMRPTMFAPHSPTRVGSPYYSLVPRCAFRSVLFIFHGSSAGKSSYVAANDLQLTMGQESEYPRSGSSRLFRLDEATTKHCMLSPYSSFFCSAASAQFYLDQAQQSYPHYGGRPSLSRETDVYFSGGNGHQNRQNKFFCKADVEETEA